MQAFVMRCLVVVDRKQCSTLSAFRKEKIKFFSTIY